MKKMWRRKCACRLRCKYHTRILFSNKPQQFFLHESERFAQRVSHFDRNAPPWGHKVNLSILVCLIVQYVYLPGMGSLDARNAHQGEKCRRLSPRTGNRYSSFNIKLLYFLCSRHLLSVNNRQNTGISPVGTSMLLNVQRKIKFCCFPARCSFNKARLVFDISAL